MFEHFMDYFWRYFQKVLTHWTPVLIQPVTSHNSVGHYFARSIYGNGSVTVLNEMHGGSIFFLLLSPKGFAISFYSDTIYRVAKSS